MAGGDHEEGERDGLRRRRGPRHKPGAERLLQTHVGDVLPRVDDRESLDVLRERVGIPEGRLREAIDWLEEHHIIHEQSGALKLLDVPFQERYVAWTAVAAGLVDAAELSKKGFRISSEAPWGYILADVGLQGAAVVRGAVAREIDAIVSREHFARVEQLICAAYDTGRADLEKLQQHLHRRAPEEAVAVLSDARWKHLRVEARMNHRYLLFRRPQTT